MCPGRRVLVAGFTGARSGLLKRYNVVERDLWLQRVNSRSWHGSLVRCRRGSRTLCASSRGRESGAESAVAYPQLGEVGPAQVGPQSDGLSRYPGVGSARQVLRAADWLGTVTFAASGSITAATCGMDVLGATIVGTITAIGGGTIRDSIILHKQPFWIKESEYFLMAAGVAFLTFWAWPELPSGNAIKNKEGGEGSAMWLGDALGVGAFAVIGAQNALRMCVHPAIATACGLVTGCGGGLVRDVLCHLPADRPSSGRILHSASDIYASTALAGAGAYILARRAKLPYAARVLGGVGCAMGLRFTAKEYSIGLPTWEKPGFQVEIGSK